jgi:hypothetical protein
LVVFWFVSRNQKQFFQFVSDPMLQIRIFPNQPSESFRMTNDLDSGVVFVECGVLAVFLNLTDSQHSIIYIVGNMDGKIC